MSGHVAIRVDRISKAYRVGLAEKRHDTLTGAIAAAFKAPLSNFRAVRDLSRFDGQSAESVSAIAGGRSIHQDDVHWALRDVSFDVKQGEAIGIIGRNGAGKSTLLKVLSRITEPTSGRATIHGRVASLLEVGTGFHPDLTGRENVYLNGTLLGLRKREVDARLEEIVEFAGTAKYIDTPVKRYSSGMRVRLAFAVAAHLDPEILIVDEVLAVGDLDFQRKCLGRMQRVAEGGRTVLFVSHNLAAVAQLCQRAVVLEGGKLVFAADVAAAIDRYLRSSDSLGGDSAADGDRRSTPDLRINGTISPRVRVEDPLLISVSFDAPTEDARIIVILEDASGTPILHERGEVRWNSESVMNGRRTVELEVPSLALSPGLYSVHAKVLLSVLDGRGRLRSERLPLEVRGETSTAGRALLAPPVHWRAVGASARRGH